MGRVFLNILPNIVLNMILYITWRGSVWPHTMRLKSEINIIYLFILIYSAIILPIFP